MSDIRVEIDTSGFDIDIHAIENAISEEIRDTAYKVERQAKELAPIDTGELRKSITTDGGGLEYAVDSNLEYAPHVEFGTSPHVIEGNDYLYWEGAEHPVRRVNHPGNEAYLYLKTAFDAQTDGLENRILDAIDDIL